MLYNPIRNYSSWGIFWNKDHVLTIAGFIFGVVQIWLQKSIQPAAKNTFFLSISQNISKIVKKYTF